MKTTMQQLIRLFAVLVILAGSLAVNRATAQPTNAPVKIGTYDSRTVIFAWSRSDRFREHMAAFRQRSDSAQTAHDSVRIKELTAEAISFQHLLHQMVFSNGSVSSFMAVVAGKLPELAKSAGVSMIVSKWELNYSDPAIETVDLTSQVAALFGPKENIDRMAADIQSNPPVPIGELTIEMEMLDGFCQRFGKK
jgi:hypothetical protein